MNNVNNIYLEDWLRYYSVEGLYHMFQSDLGKSNSFHAFIKSGLIFATNATGPYPIVSLIMLSAKLGSHCYNFNDFSMMPHNLRAEALTNTQTLE